ISGDSYISPEAAALATGFVTTWQTDKPGTAASDSITIPIGAGDTDFTVFWGDGTSTDYTGGPATHTYASAGTYTVAIVGDFPGVNFNGGGDGDKLLSVEQWGNIAWQDLNDAFEGAENLVINASDAPDLSGVTDLSAMFRGATSINQDLNNWDTSSVTNMSYMFSWATAFNQDISDWNTSSVTDLSNMFRGANAFNQDISGWDTSSVINMASMFQDSAFNQDLSGWDTSSVTNMSYMFRWNSAFNGDLSGWDTSSVTQMREMFRAASAFNGDLSGWETLNVNNMDSMFDSAVAFNQDIGGWDISDVTTMASMLDGAGLSVGNYDATLSGWAAQTVQSGVALGASGLQYSLSAADRQSLIDDDSWTISGDSFVSNTAPTAANGTILTNEDATYTFSTADFNYSDGDGDPLDHVTITSVESIGILRLGGTDMLVGSEVSKAAIDAGYLIFTPAADASGAGYDSFDFTVNDGTGDSAGSYTMTINVSSVNDAPVFTVGDGIVTTDFGASNDYGQSVTVQSDGKILVAGSAKFGAVYDFALARYNVDGSLDTSFDGDGWATAEYGSWTQDKGYSGTVQNDGKILVAGTTNNGSTYDFTLVRFTADGTFDNSFDGDGFLTTPIGSADDHGYSVTVQSDGKILVAGESHNGSDYDFALVRYNTDGSLDATFDSDGILTTDFGSGDDVGNSVTVQSDGKILVA
ncbi:MAG: BspA family leucine-rich repeat surface protein, partial [Halieaceae bacterium]|nr:BspA family leucine-rich repeat surface protein [Halieaceae bacterium]